MDNQQQLELAYLTTLIADINYHNNTELRRFLLIGFTVLLTGLTPVYNLILYPLLFNTSGMLLSLKKVKQKENVLSDYIKFYVICKLKCV